MLNRKAGTIYKGRAVESTAQENEGRNERPRNACDFSLEAN